MSLQKRAPCVARQRRMAQGPQWTCEPAAMAQTQLQRKSTGSSLCSEATQVGRTS